MKSKKQHKNTDLIALLIERERLKNKPKISQEEIREKAKRIYPEFFDGTLLQKLRQSFLKGE